MLATYMQEHVLFQLLYYTVYFNLIHIRIYNLFLEPNISKLV